MAASAITEPTAIPAVILFSFAPTNIRKNVRITSIPNACISGTAGSVAPKHRLCGNSNLKMMLARIAPEN